MKKLYLSILFLLTTCIAFSQTYRLFGMSGEASYTFRGNFICFRPTVSFNKPKYIIYAGPAINKIALPQKHWFDTDRKTMAVSGIVVGVKYYLKSDRRKRVYHYFDNLILRYHTHDMLEYIYPEKDLQIVSSGYFNSVFLLQSMVGTGFEYRVLKYMRYSFDIGFGYSYRKFTYQESYKDNPTHVAFFTFQLKSSLGFVL